MESWRKYAVECEELMFRATQAKSELEANILIRRAAAKFDQGRALLRAGS